MTASQSDTSAIKRILTNNAGAVFIFWLIYASAYMALRRTHGLEPLAGVLSLFGEAGLDLVICIYLFKLFRQGKERILFLIGLIGFAFSFVSDFSYNIILNIMGIDHFSDKVENIFDIPFFLFLLMQVFFWLKIAIALKNKARPHFKGIIYLPLSFSVISIFFIFIVIPVWKIKFGSEEGLYQILDTICELTAFILVMVCLAASNKRFLNMIAIGYLIIIASDFTIRYSEMAQNLLPGSPLETCWTLGLLLMLYGFIKLHKEAQDTDIRSWLCNWNSIQLETGFSAFSFCIFSIVILFILINIFHDGNYWTSVFLGGDMPFILIAFSILALLISKFFAMKITEPFNHIQELINKFNVFEQIPIPQKSAAKFGIDEFCKIEDCLIDALETLHQKESLKNRQIKLGGIASQVAHDIKSPATALLVLAQECADIPESHRIMLREATQDILDIANNLLDQYQATEKVNLIEHKHQQLLFSALILEVISTKRLQYKSKGVKFEPIFTPKAHFAFLDGDQTQFKRMLSNLINNAVDACNHEATKIIVSLDVSERYLTVSVIDNGKGMPPELIERIMKEEPLTTGKEDGHGIGLNQVRQTLKEYQGTLEILSEVGKGTQVNLIFPRLKTPGWIADHIEFAPGSQIIVLDDDGSIHIAWDHRLQDVTANNRVQVLHFKEADAAINHINQLSEVEKASIFLLTDYELLKQSMNGLDVLEVTGIKNSVLVTSHYTNRNVVKRAVLLGAKVLPKLLVVEIQINLKAPIEKAVIEPVDVIIVDDKPQFMEITIRHQLKDKKVKYYADPYEFIKEYAFYSKDTPICLDNDFGIAEFTGRDLAEKLHHEEYQHLYLISGSRFKDLPDYLTALGKNEIKKALHVAPEETPNL